MNIRPEAQKRARDYIDGAIRLQRKHGRSVDIQPEIYESVVQRTAELFEKTMRLSDDVNETPDESKALAA